MNTPNNKRKKASQERIEKVFLQLIQSKDISEIRVCQICELANVNRTTFYANYIDIYDLADTIRNRMINEYASIFNNDLGHSKESFLKMFKNIKNNQVFYNTFFKLDYDNSSIPKSYLDMELAKKWNRDKLIEYHLEFFKAGISAIIKKWLYNGCVESPEEITNVIITEYMHK